MENYEKAQKVCEMCGVTYEEARRALEANEWDVLDAIVYLEKLGKATPRTATYATQTGADYQATLEMSQAQSDYEQATRRSAGGEKFSRVFNRAMDAVRRLFKRGVEVSFVASRGESQVFSMPAILLVLLALLAFWVVFPLLIVGLFFGFRYRFDGLGAVTIDVNDMADKMSQAAANLKHDVMGDQDKEAR